MKSARGIVKQTVKVPQATPEALTRQAKPAARSPDERIAMPATDRKWADSVRAISAASLLCAICQPIEVVTAPPRHTPITSHTSTAETNGAARTGQSWPAPRLPRSGVKKNHVLRIMLCRRTSLRRPAANHQRHDLARERG